MPAQAPQKVEPKRLGDYLEVMTKAVFQSGISWRVIEATIDNAVELLALDKEFGGFRNYLRSHGGFLETVADLKRRFRFLGDMGAYYFLYVVGEEVPPHEECMAALGRRSQARS